MISHALYHYFVQKKYCPTVQELKGWNISTGDDKVTYLSVQLVATYSLSKFGFHCLVCLECLEEDLCSIKS